MTNIQELFLEAVAAALKNEYVHWSRDISDGDWSALFRLAEGHRMLPMVYQAVYRCPAAGRADPALMQYYRLCSMQLVALQSVKTAEFHTLLESLRTAGVRPLVVKGITCRELYPNPDHRYSNDEDILIPPEDFSLCHRVLTQAGFQTPDPESSSYELSYRNPRGALFLEIHRSLFPPESPAYGDLNRYFRDARDRSCLQMGVPTLDPTDHLLYLICHAFKHFLHSGFGLRQVCDLVLYANRYGAQIQWPYILNCCRQIRAEKFAAGLFRIGWKHLGFSLADSRYPLSWQAIYVDEAALLEDILQAGVYGSADRDRVHSSSITLNAVAGQKQPESSGSLLQTAFPPLDIMARKYPYVKDKPMLLPIAWMDRILKYGKSTATVSDTLRIGQERLALLKRYGILEENGPAQGSGGKP